MDRVRTRGWHLLLPKHGGLLRPTPNVVGAVSSKTGPPTADKNWSRESRVVTQPDRRLCSHPFPSNGPGSRVWRFLPRKRAHRQALAASGFTYPAVGRYAMHFVYDVFKWVARWISAFRCRRLERRAVRIAIARFSKLHPHWYESCFDEVFLRRLPVSRLGAVGAEELALEWTRQFRYSDQRVRNRDVRQVRPVADSFLRLLADVKDELYIATPRGELRDRSPIDGSIAPCSCARGW